MSDSDRSPQVGGGEVAAAWGLAAVALFALFVAGWVSSETEQASTAPASEQAAEAPEMGRWHDEAQADCDEGPASCIGPRP